jgi:hypothetical protein
VAADSKEPKQGRRKPHPKALANLEKGKFKPGQSGNPGGRRKGFTRPLVDATVAFYSEHPERLTELVVRMHDGAMGRAEVTMTQVAAFQALQKVVDQMHRKQDGSERVVQESITIVLPTDGRAPERAKMTLDVAGESRPTFELPPDPDDPRDATP